jgi:hypothetical protein
MVGGGVITEIEKEGEHLVGLKCHGETMILEKRSEGLVKLPGIPV